MLWLHVDREWGEAAVVGCAQLIDRDVFRCFEDLVADFFWCLDVWRLWVDESDESDLFRTIRNDPVQIEIDA